MQLSIDHISGRTVAWQFLAGPALVFSRSGFYLSPSFLVGISDIAMRYNRYYDTVHHYNPGKMKVIDLFSISGSKITGLMINPSLKAGYNISSQMILSLTAHYVFGPGFQVTTESYHLPIPSSPSGIYTYDEISNGGESVGDGVGRWKGTIIQLNLSYKIKTTDRSRSEKNGRP